MKPQTIRMRAVAVSILAIWYAVVTVLWPGFAGADAVITAPEAPVAVQSLLITEVQTGTAESAAEEFVELYNASDVAIDITGWQLQMASSGAEDWESPHRVVQLEGSMEPGAYMVVASSYGTAEEKQQYLATTASFWFSAGLAAAGGEVRLVHPVPREQPDGSCVPEQITVSELTWEDIPPEQSLQRLVGIQGEYAHTNVSMQDFGLAAPTPGIASTGVVLTNESNRAVAVEGNCTPPVPAPDTNPEAPAEELPEQPLTPVLPPADVGLVAPQISELLPNPAAPALDAEGEYIELYNPNDAPFDLTGFSMHAGLTGSHTYRFTEGTLLPPGGFVSFYVPSTGLVLSNTAGKVVLLDPFDTVIAQSEPYDKAPPGEAWVYANNTWAWTVQPTPNAANVIAAPVLPPAKQTSTPAPAAVKAASTKKVSTPKVATIKKPKAAPIPKPKPTAAEPKAPAATPLSTNASTNTGLLHPGVLVAAAVLAVLYGAYEYRHDMANKIQQFRANRAARRAARQSLKGR